MRTKIKLREVMPLVGGVALGVLAGILCVRTAEELVPADAGVGGMLIVYGLLLLAMCLIIVMHIALHEAGHGICGALSGYRFVSYRIFGLMWIRREDGRIHWARYSLAGTGGQCLMDPPEPVDGHYPFTLYNLGGSLANLIGGLGSLAVVAVLRMAEPLDTLLMLSGLIGLAFALLNGVPLRLGLISNDGMNTYELCQSDSAQRAFWLQMRANACLARGVRLRDMPEAWFTLPQPDDGGSSLVASIAPLAANQLVDQHRFDEAITLIRRILARPGATPEIYLLLLRCDLACCLMLTNRLAEAAALIDEDLHAALKPLASQLGVQRTWYGAALLLDKDPEQAQVLRAQLDKTMRSYPYPAEAEGERELLALLEALSVC